MFTEADSFFLRQVYAHYDLMFPWLPQAMARRPRDPMWRPFVCEPQNQPSNMVYLPDPIDYHDKS